jgi:hypothetical protein
MKEYVKAIDKASFLVKLILALPVLDGIAYGLYRIGKGRIIIGILWIIIGIPLLWIVDLISVILFGKVTILV